MLISNLGGNNAVAKWSSEQPLLRWLSYRSESEQEIKLARALGLLAFRITLDSESSIISDEGLRQV